MAKKAVRNNDAAKENGTPKRGSKPQRSFPAVTLEEALKIPQAIRQKNNGHPWERRSRSSSSSRRTPARFSTWTT
jgi:hypothetical protein